MDDTPGLRASAGLRIKAALHAARLWFIFVAALTAIVAVLSVPLTTRGVSLGLGPGGGGQQNIPAPYALAYTSNVLTLQARQAAAVNVPDVYDTPDSRISRQQYERLRASLDFIDAIRADRYATPDQKLADPSWTSVSAARSAS